MKLNYFQWILPAWELSQLSTQYSYDSIRLIVWKL
jgi:hypothetical protein